MEEVEEPRNGVYSARRRAFGEDEIIDNYYYWNLVVHLSYNTRCIMNPYKYDLEDDIQRVVYTEQQIQNRVSEMAREMDKDIHSRLGSEDIWERPPIAICILRGAAVFMADLTRRIQAPVEYDFMSISSYRDATEPGEVRVIKDLERSITNRVVIVIEDIIDTGETLNHVLRGLKAKNPRSVIVCTLIDKISRRSVDLDIDFNGFTLEEDLFIVGYGMDYAGKYRNLPFIGILNEEMIDK